ncbi:interleukin-7 isoform X2 [Myotis myotis]|uniref:interleukin-7 isoform X2 n=1 Tax=Myotis myotis TaxID=51298 RepID=UPI001747EC59|nr:interleukin-7 isoform X2 [Myotis myotis]
MFHVSFRYIFGIPPLILVLLPVASSDCEIEGKSGEEYQHVIMVSLNDLEATFLKTAARKLKQFLKMNIHEEFKLHLSIVSQGTLKLLNCTRKRGREKDKELETSMGEKHLSAASCTLPTGDMPATKDKEKKQPSLGEVQPTKNLEEKKSSKGQKKQDEMCFLMILLEKIKTCWNKILSGTKEH